MPSGRLEFYQKEALVAAEIVLGRGSSVGNYCYGSQQGFPHWVNAQQIVIEPDKSEPRNLEQGILNFEVAILASGS